MPISISAGGALNKCLRIKSEEQARIAKAVDRERQRTRDKIGKVLDVLSPSDRERVERALEGE